jgi:hypothetical protein
MRIAMCCHITEARIFCHAQHRYRFLRTFDDYHRSVIAHVEPQTLEGY